MVEVFDRQRHHTKHSQSFMEYGEASVCYMVISIDGTSIEFGHT